MTDSSGTRSALSSRAAADLRLGVREHRTGGKVIPFYSLGILAGFIHSTSAAPGFGSDRNGWSAGVFGDVGGSYMVTSNLALAATGTLTLRYTRETIEQTNPFETVRFRTWDLSGGAPNATLLVILFF